MALSNSGLFGRVSPEAREYLEALETGVNRTLDLGQQVLEAYSNGGHKALSALLTKEQILRAQDLPVERVSVPEWGGDLLVRAITGAERDRFEMSITDQSGAKTKVNLMGARARLVVMTVVDEANDPLFTEAEIHILSQKGAAALNRVYDVAARLAGLTKEDLESLVGKEKPGSPGETASEDSLID